MSEEPRQPRNPDDHHRAAAATLWHALTAGADPDVWDALVAIWMARLTPAERAVILAAALLAVDEEDCIPTIADCFGCPEPQIRAWSETPVADAILTAETSTLEELRATLAASYAALPDKDRQAFLASVRP